MSKYQSSSRFTELNTSANQNTKHLPSKKKLPHLS